MTCSAWRYFWPLTALIASIGMGHALGSKAIPQAAQDACAAYCEMELD